MLKNLLPLLLCIILFSCSENVVKTEYKATEGGQWGKENVMKLTFSGMDTIQKNDIFININGSVCSNYISSFDHLRQRLYNRVSRRQVISFCE